MVRIASLLVSVLASVAAADACAGWFQCKNADGSHCCVVDSSSGRGACPSHCTGTIDMVECISQTTGNSRHPCNGK
ncbi:hypothetical protein E4U09_006722 [Claviceps aff. purpurea]|uniref:Extracellular membrane protein CFEM domain-containing protein n=1 Tax=Claviceps aff. purpurea TaxID=1967640 RepID=A0A9P7QL12_9HYPO|nr:hypothetical protein E4U09_006722 [Claviceps aff. purpurea]